MQIFRYMFHSQIKWAKQQRKTETKITSVKCAKNEKKRKKKKHGQPANGMNIKIRTDTAH